MKLSQEKPRDKSKSKKEHKKKSLEVVDDTIDINALEDKDFKNMTLDQVDAQIRALQGNVGDEVDEPNAGDVAEDQIDSSQKKRVTKAE